MAQSYVTGTFNRDDMIGIPESVSQQMASLNNVATPLLSVVSPNLNNLYTPVQDTTHYFFEKAWRPLRTTLASACGASDTSIEFTDQAFKEGELVVVDEEVIELGAESPAKTFDITGKRSIGSAAAAAHAAGASALGLGKSHVSGSAAGTGDMIVQPDKVTQYTRIFKRECAASGTAQVLPQYFRQGSLYDSNVLEQMENLNQELENSVMRGVAQAAVADTTDGRFDGIYERLAAASCTTSLSGGTPTRDHVRSALRSIKDYAEGSAYADWLFCSDYAKDVIDDWQLPRVQLSPTEQALYGVDVSRLLLGGVTINVKAMSKLKTHMLLLTSNMVRVGPLTGPGGSREFKHTYHGRDGDRIKGDIVGEYTCQVMSPKVHHLFYNVASS